MIGARGVFPAQSDSRIRLWTMAMSIGFFGLVLRLFDLQILKGVDLYRLAEQNRTQVIPLSAPRGFVMDRNGDVFIDNAPHFSLFYARPAEPSALDQDVENELSRWFPESPATLRRKIFEARRSGKMTRLLTGIPRDTALALIEKKLVLPGVNVVVEPQRRARYGDLASHLLGYVDEISPQELDRHQSEGYRMGQLIGKAGVERMYDAYLRGQDGGLQFEMDAGGRHVHIMRRISSESGADVVLTLDRRLQEAAENGLKKSPTGRGAAVVMDPRTGAVLALASQPGFDPVAPRADYLDDPGLPFFNRALQGSYPPGSVFKIMTGMAGLLQNWNIHKTYYCPGVFRLGSREFGCWNVHHTQNFMGAVAFSCNVYFFNMGLFAGPDNIERMARSFGLGQKTGIDLPSESSGLIPGRGWKMSSQKASWYDGDTVNLSIGQGAVVVTPLQAAVMMSAVANGGSLWRPYVVDRIVNNGDGRRLFQQQSLLRRKIDLPEHVWSLIHQSLRGVVTTGSGRGILRPDLVSGAKTGTAQNPHGGDHAWFAAYAGLPGQDPSLVVVVFVENGGHGSSAAGPVAREVINAAFPKNPQSTEVRVQQPKAPQ